MTSGGAPSLRVAVNLSASQLRHGDLPDTVRQVLAETQRRFLPVEDTFESYYLQAQYRFRPGWSALARYDALFADIDDHDGSATARQTGLPRHRFYAKDLAFGLRWEFARCWLIAAEYHDIDGGTAWLSPFDNPGIKTRPLRAVRDGHWDLLAVMLSHRF